MSEKKPFSLLNIFLINIRHANHSFIIFSVTQDAFDNVCNIWDLFYCEAHVTIEKLEIFVRGRAHQAWEN